MAGWSAAVQVVTPAPLFDDTRSMWTGRHVLPERWVLEGNAGEMGGAYDWLACLLSGGRSCTAPYDSLARLAAASPQGARGVSAYLGPSFVNISGVGLRTGGLLFPVPISFEPPDRGSLVRAAIENFAFAIRYNLDRLDLAVGGLRDIACGGGMARTKLFREVTAACAGRPVGFGIMGDATARGALSITGAATGEGLALDAAAERRRRELNVVEPGATDAGVYQDLYDSWRLRERRVLDIEL
jgi:autoinducer 2 (AI-2) kinase